MVVQPYNPSLKNEWDSFVENTANATFLHRRDYMDYHSDRFRDCSVLIRNDKGKIVALLPACFEDKTVYSHKGLTYGGMLVARRHFAPAQMVEAFNLLLSHFRNMGMKKLIYKPVPHIFTPYPSEADIFALSQAGATISRCQLSSAIPLNNPLLFNDSSRQRASNNIFNYVISSSPDEFWQLLNSVLSSRHETKPVHSLQEIQLLMNRFPNNIKLTLARASDNSLLAGALLFITSQTVHFQYIAVSDDGRKAGVFPWLVKQIITNECNGKQFLDFGTSNIPETNELDTGLSNQKYFLGGRPVAFLSFALDL